MLLASAKAASLVKNPLAGLASALFTVPLHSGWASLNVKVLLCCRFVTWRKAQKAYL